MRQQGMIRGAEMGSGEYNNLRCYMQSEGGNKQEITQIKEVDLTNAQDILENFVRDNVKITSGDTPLTLTIMLNKRKMDKTLRKAMREYGISNNWRKLHGIPMIRKGWI